MKRYCGRSFSEKEIEQIRLLIQKNPSHSRFELSKQACRLLNWCKPDGGLKDMTCRIAMLRMHRDGSIQLPAPRRKRPICKISSTSNTDPLSPVTLPVHKLPPLQLKCVRSQKESRLWNEYIHRYHYPGHTLVPGAQLRYVILAKEQPLALISFAASAWQVAPRDHFIGWTHEQRKRNLHLVINNTRFLILPWVRSKCLASKILSLCAKKVPVDWIEYYRFRPALMETFVEKNRFQGTCYKAANWVHVGQTKGRGKLGQAGKISVPIKDIWLYTITPKFRSFLAI